MKIYTVSSVLQSVESLKKLGYEKLSLGMGDVCEEFVMKGPDGYRSIVFTEAYTSEYGVGYKERSVDEISKALLKRIEEAKRPKVLSFEEKQKREAIARMKLLRIYSDAIEQFRKGDVLMKSEAPFGALYWLDDGEKEMVSKFEKKYGAKAYIVVRSNTTFGLMDSILYVSKDEDEWEMDREDLEGAGTEKYPMNYTVNHEDEFCSEFGSIGVRLRYGGLVRCA